METLICQDPPLERWLKKEATWSAHRESCPWTRVDCFPWLVCVCVCVCVCVFFRLVSRGFGKIQDECLHKMEGIQIWGFPFMAKIHVGEFSSWSLRVSVGFVPPVNGHGPFQVKIGRAWKIKSENTSSSFRAPWRTPPMPRHSSWIPSNIETNYLWTALPVYRRWF